MGILLGKGFSTYRVTRPRLGRGFSLTGSRYAQLRLLGVAGVAGGTQKAQGRALVRDSAGAPDGASARQSKA